MRTLLHIESGFTLDLEKYADVDVIELAAVIKDEIDVRIGRISLNNLVQGNVQCAQGFEVVVTDGTETEEVETETPVVEEPTAEPEVETQPEPEVEEVETPETETAETEEVETPETEEVETPTVDKTPEEETSEGAVIVGDLGQDIVETNHPSVAAPVSGVETETPVETEEPTAEPEAQPEPEAEEPNSFAADLLKGKMGQGAKSKDFNETNKRRHTKKEVAIQEARDHKEYGALITGLEALGLAFNYSQPDLRWFELVITDEVTEDNATSRKNPYVDVAPRKNGSIGVSLYLGGKSATKREVFKEVDGQTAVEATLAGVAELLKGEYATLIKG